MSERDDTDLAQALRDFCDKMDTFHPRGEMGALRGTGMAFAYKDAAQGIRRILAAHEPRAQPPVKPPFVLERWGFPVGFSKYRIERMADGYWTPWHIAQQALADTRARMQYEFDKALESRAQAASVTVADVCAALDRIPLSERKPAAPLPAQPDVNEGCQRVMRARGKPYPRTCKVCDWHGPCVVSDAQLAALEGQPPAKDERE